MEKYEQIKEIGKGNYGKAILVKNVEDNNFYVMKVIRRLIKLIEISNFTREQLETALYEVNVIKKLKHPFIIKYIESFYDELRNLCIVMEYADCGDLNKLVKSQKKIQIPLKEDIILNWFVQLCFAVKYIHDKKILHRDLKSSNIFICSNGNIKLGDFGIAKVLKNTNEFAKTIVGTPYYLSPEICLRKPYNQKSDIWSMGCILFELMNLSHAFEGENIGELIIRILKGNYEPLNTIYSIELRNLVKDILNINCDLRPDLNTILEKKFLLHYIKLTLIRLITSNSCRKYQQPQITDNKSIEKSKKSTDKRDKTDSKNSNNQFVKLNQINLSKKQASQENSSKSNERIIIDNSSNNSKFKKVTSLLAYKSSNNPSENNSFNNKSRSQSKSKEMIDNNYIKSSNNNHNKQTSNNTEKKASVDEKVNNFFNKIVENKPKKKPLETYSDISSTSNIDFSTQKLDKNEDKSVFTKIEKLKTYLEKILGLDIFIELYFKINEIYSKKLQTSINDLDFSKYKITNETTKKQIIKLIKSLIKLENKLY